MLWYGRLFYKKLNFFISHKYFHILTFSAIVSNVIRVELHSLILENRRKIHEINYFSNVVIEEISGHGNASKRCRQNYSGKQYRPWSDCSFWSSLIWVYAVCPALSIQKLWIAMELLETCWSAYLGRKCTQSWSLNLQLQQIQTSIWQDLRKFCLHISKAFQRHFSFYFSGLKWWNDLMKG